LTTPLAEMEMLTGLMVKLMPLEAPPALDNVMLALPAAVMRLAGTAAVNCVALENVVDSGEPFHCTIAPDANPVPVTVSVKPAPPAVAELGVSDVMTGRAGVIGWLRIAIAAGLIPAAKGEPGTGVKAPLLELIAYAEILSELGPN
jgi:hypothetical protein